mmetsp:Transcript_111422/g.347297  ORF Transcript_111422/g.347297 Transcript_111422/m.347297 type:complete len:323 (+) Transcript_111422:550-1518(+)
MDKPSPVYVPAKFSIVLGQGAGAAAPFPYCPESALPESAAVQWETPNAAGCFVPFCAGTHSATSMPLGRFSNFSADPGSLPLAAAVGSSSSFLGGFLLSGLAVTIKSALGGVFPLWASSAPAGEAFATAQRLVNGIGSSGRPGSPQVCDELADQSVRALIDGGYTENTGIAHAVASGATDVTSFLSTEPEALFSLFQGGPKSDIGGLTFLYYPIFEERHEQIREEFAKFQQLAMPQGDGVLNGLAVGTLSVTTVQNESFGIAGGTRVTLRIVSVMSSLTIGFAQNFKDYGVLLGQLVRECSEAMAMPENDKVMEAMVDQMCQ